MQSETIKIVTIGGGSGQSRLLSALRTLPAVEITAICGMTDSGGSTAKISSAYNLSNCIGDATKCMLGLCPYPAWKEKLLWRYDYPSPKEYEVNFKNHSLKNLLFAGLEKQLSLIPAIEFMSEILQIAPHRVLPISTQNSTLVARIRDGRVTIAGQTLIDTISRNPLWDPDLHALQDFYLEPGIKIYSEVKRAILDADYVIFSPGDLFTSLIPNLLVKGTPEALQKTRGKLIFLPNLMTKPGETDKFSIGDMVKWVEKFCSRKIDIVICNNAAPPRRLLKKYRNEHKSEPVLNTGEIDAQVFMFDLLDTSENNIRHSSEKVAQAVSSVLGI